MEAAAETVRALKARNAPQLEVRRAVEAYATERVRELQTNGAPEEEVEAAKANLARLQLAPLVNEHKSSVVDQKTASGEGENVVLHVRAPETEQKHLEAKRDVNVLVNEGPPRSLEIKSSSTELQLDLTRPLTWRPLAHPLAPHVYLGFCDIGMVGYRLLSSMTPSGQVKLLSEEAVAFSQSLDSCWKGAPVTVRTFGRNNVPELSMLLINCRPQGPSVPVLARSLVDLISTSNVREVTVFAGAYFISPLPSTTVHWGLLNQSKKPAFCSRCGSISQLPPSAVFKDALLSTLAFFLRISAIPTLILLMSAKRFHAGQDDGTGTLLRTFGDLIFRATRHGSQVGFKWGTMPSQRALPETSSAEPDAGFYM